MTRERSMVPEAEFRSYYGRPVLKAPVWHEPHMPTYLYSGGLSGASSVMAVMAGLTGHDRLARTARVAAALGAAAGTGFLIAELGRPSRFLNMFRVFKPTSPMSLGSWLLAAQGGLSAVAASTELTGILPVAGDAAALATGLTGPLTATYTAVVVADTAVPAWHEAYRELPFLFAGSALASAGAVGMLATPRAEAGPARVVAVVGAVVESVAGMLMERRLGLVGEPYRVGKAGRLMLSARVLTAGGGLLAAVAGRGRVLTALSGLALTAGALCTRFGILEAGRASAADPKYTVVPQRERLCT
ncbi:NrfD/PsrC family molybdoenzyme membrane anchor subunit [Nonomuraea guangzhouensis]|uniref:NrfD/PsrC family molybdoenzyme membrane anchor subunit n=1 Tax=Nonomuraea guangzhouensis TaxID=1291555 RepID=A0ABW4G308_9ACTN|nr:NrfD/PsrC family molybdoenzyme membrane anchor subunit [Nonomuraea guangzhouensis]